MTGDPRAAYLRVQAITIPVSDSGRGLTFDEGSLGFRVIVRETALFDGGRIGVVAPPDGSAILVLSERDDDSRLGTATGVCRLRQEVDRARQ